ncbi:hypothetical protein CGZ80_03830 [Rhodopirellula sp. MGV]|nr:hypothetical protein CGZ80_03830 [Rhodopirellula sp. MGV]
MCFLFSLLVLGCAPTAKDSGGYTPAADVESDTQASQVNGTADAKMREAIARQDWKSAERYSNQALIESPDDPGVMTLAAGVLAFRDRKRDAATLLADAARVADFEPASRVENAIRGLMDVGEIYAAIELLEQSLKRFPNRDAHRQILIGFYNEVQRSEQIPEHLQVLIAHRHFTLPLLLTTTENSSRRLSEKSAERLLQRNPKDHRVRLSEAFLYLYRRQFKSAAEVLDDVLKHHPDFAAAYAMKGQALVGMSQWQAIPDWLSSAPNASKQYADYWLTLGDYLQNSGQLAPSVRAYWEACRRAPSRALSWSRLGQAARQLKASGSELASQVDPKDLQAIEKHTERLLAIRDAFNDFAGHSKDSQHAAFQVAHTLFDAGRTWEAEAWSAIAATLEKQPTDELAVLRQQIVQSLKADQSWITKHAPALLIDYSKLPEPSIASVASTDAKAVIPERTTHDHIQFVERGSEWGLDGVGNKNDPSDPKLAPLIRSTGAGGGAIDFDLDGSVDIAVINAGGTMMKLDSMPNQLLRNVGARFESVGDRAGFHDKRFGQGIAVGDINEDGFPDMLVSNLGSNQLLRNNGDGTFTDCSQWLGDSEAAQWSTSAAFVDVDGDSITDLIIDQYCVPIPELERACTNAAGVEGPCHPMVFAGDIDQAYQSVGDGRLRNVTESWIGSPPIGRGLGIVAGKLDSRRMGVYVANDMTRNAYYPVETATTNNAISLNDTATAAGLAVDGRSLAQASMGIAAGDFDSDGDLDFYVTGFGREYNIYYEQISPGLWRDTTAKQNLIVPTLEFVAFGTQAIDFDNDGIDELVVTNGNIGQFSEPGADRYEQPFQAFRRGDTGAFMELEHASWGPYFQSQHVGRALWRADVDRDGRCDFLITHTRERIALVMNETQSEANRIGFQLVGTRSSRDAIGAVIRFKVDGNERTVWQLSGDGYFCSNEKKRLVGLGGSTRVTDVRIEWPDGSTEQLPELAANRDYLIVQGSEEGVEIATYQ